MEEFVNHMFSAPRNVLSKVHVDTASSGPGEGGKACYPVELELPVSMTTYGKRILQWGGTFPTVDILSLGWKSHCFRKYPTTSP